MAKHVVTAIDAAVVDATDAAVVDAIDAAVVDAFDVTRRRGGQEGCLPFGAGTGR